MKFKSNKKNVMKALNQAEERTLKGIGELVEGQAKLLAPVDSGNLRGSLRHEVDPEEKRVIVGTNIEYAPYVEKGTSRAKKQPFLSPAAESNKREIQALAERLMKL